MTVTVTTNKIQYTGDGVQDTFVYPFRIFEESDLEVFVDGVLQTLNTDYTVTGAAGVGGGTVVFAPTVPPDQSTVTINRAVPQTQLIDYVDYDRFPAETHEGGLDKLTILIQQVQEEVDRAVKYTVAQVPEDDFTVSFGSAAERAGKIWAFDETGLVVVVIDPAQDKAYRWAEEEEDVVVENIGGQDRFSAHHWAIKAANQVTPPMTEQGELYGHSGVGPTQVLALRADGITPAEEGDFIIRNTAVASGIVYAAPSGQLPALQAGDKLKTLQVNITEDGYELTGQYASTLVTGDEILQSDESGGETSIVHVPHYKVVGAQFTNPGPSTTGQGFAKFVLRRRDALTWDFFLRFTPEIGTVAGSGNVAFAVTAHIYSAGTGLLDPPDAVIGPVSLVTAVPATDKDSVLVQFPALVPLGGSEPDVLCMFQIDRIHTGDTFEANVDVVTCSVGPA